MMRWFDVSIVQGAVSLNRIGIFSPSMSNGSLSEGGQGWVACPFGGGELVSLGLVVGTDVGTTVMSAQFSSFYSDVATWLAEEAVISEPVSVR